MGERLTGRRGEAPRSQGLGARIFLNIALFLQLQKGFPFNHFRRKLRSWPLEVNLFDHGIYRYLLALTNKNAPYMYDAMEDIFTHEALFDIKVLVIPTNQFGFNFKLSERLDIPNIGKLGRINDRQPPQLDEAIQEPHFGKHVSTRQVHNCGITRVGYVAVDIAVQGQCTIANTTGTEEIDRVAVANTPDE